MTDDKTEAPTDERCTDLQTTLCDDGKHINVRNPRSGSGDVHTVTLAAAGLQCTCAGFQYNRKCYHIEAIENSPIVLSAASALRQDVLTDGGSKTIYTADCADCMYCPSAYERGPAHDAKERHEAECEGHNVTVRVDEGEDIHMGII